VTPLEVLAAWMAEARVRGMREPEAMALATATPDGVPSVRIVLCRAINAKGLRFFTNYESRKGHELGSNPRAAVVFHWPILERQARVEGSIARLPAEASDAYFHSRPRGHQLSAWASAQSHPIASQDELRRSMQDLAARYEGQVVPRPDYWGGFELEASAVELWTQGSDRVHDRVRYDRVGARAPLVGQPSAEDWSAQRLAP
jgi:pyridoxamine 5'-phosphate oxidase